MRLKEKFLESALRFVRDRAGVSTVEYALIVVAVIAIVGMGAGMLSGAFGTLFTNLDTQMDGAPAAVTSQVNPPAAPGGGAG